MTNALALSLWQPWASLLVAGIKTIETRRWSTRFRGRLLIHAAQAQPLSKIPRDVQALAQTLIGERWTRLVPFGAVVGSVHVVDVLPIEHRPFHGGISPYVGDRRVEGRELTLGDYSAGRFGWVVEQPFAFSKPLAARGRQRLFACPIPLEPAEIDSVPAADIVDALLRRIPRVACPERMDGDVRELLERER